MKRSEIRRFYFFLSELKIQFIFLGSITCPGSMGVISAISHKEKAPLLRCNKTINVFWINVFYLPNFFEKESKSLFFSTILSMAFMAL